MCAVEPRHCWRSRLLCKGRNGAGSHSCRAVHLLDEAQLSMSPRNLVESEYARLIAPELDLTDEQQEVSAMLIEGECALRSHSSSACDLRRSLMASSERRLFHPRPLSSPLPDPLISPLSSSPSSPLSHPSPLPSHSRSPPDARPLPLPPAPVPPRPMRREGMRHPQGGLGRTAIRLDAVRGHAVALRVPGRGHARLCRQLQGDPRPPHSSVPTRLPQSARLRVTRGACRRAVVLPPHPPVCNAFRQAWCTRRGTAPACAAVAARPPVRHPIEVAIISRKRFRHGSPTPAVGDPVRAPRVPEGVLQRLPGAPQDDV